MPECDPLELSRERIVIVVVAIGADREERRLGLENGSALSGVLRTQLSVDIEAHLVAVVARRHVVPGARDKAAGRSQVSDARRFLCDQAEIELVVPITENPTALMGAGVVHRAQNATPFDRTVDLDPRLHRHRLGR